MNTVDSRAVRETAPTIESMSVSEYELLYGPIEPMGKCVAKFQSESILIEVHETVKEWHNLGIDEGEIYIDKRFIESGNMGNMLEAATRLFKMLGV